MAKITMIFEDTPEGVHIEAWQNTSEGEREELSTAIALAIQVGDFIETKHGAKTTHTRTFKD